MSVLIKGLDMPSGCGDCPCLGGEYYRSFDSNFYCQVNDKGIGDHKPDWCRLVEVPVPHGRLIDADAMISRLENGKALVKALFGGEFEELYNTICDGILEEVKTRPTIIEREE